MFKNLKFIECKKYNITYVILMVLLSLAVLLSQAYYKVDNSDSNVSNVLIETFVPLICFVASIYALLSNKKINLLVFGALFFCFIAEFTRIFDFDLNLIFFVPCHICLSIFFIYISPFKKSDIFKLIPIAIFYLIYVLFCFLWLIPYVKSLNRGVNIIMILAVPIYGALLSFMLWRAMCTYKRQQWLIYVLGATIFYLSDLNVVIEGIIGFGSTDPMPLFIFTWVTYPIAMFLLSTFNRNTFSWVDRDMYIG